MNKQLGQLPHPPIVRDDTVHGVDYYTAEQMRAYALQERDAERARWMTVVCDGLSVLQSLDEKAKKRTNYQNVSDTLDALARVIRGGT